jgi:hypothetical protein
MSSIASFLNNSIVENTLKLILILYAGFIYKVNTSHLHSWLNDKIFSYVFISLTIYALSKKFWFSFILTALFYLLFHWLTKFENKRNNKQKLDNKHFNTVAEAQAAQAAANNAEQSDSNSESESEYEKNTIPVSLNTLKTRNRLKHLAQNRKNKNIFPRKNNTSLHSSFLQNVQTTQKEYSAPNQMKSNVNSINQSSRTSGISQLPNTEGVPEISHLTDQIVHHAMLNKNAPVKTKLQQFIDLQTQSDNIYNTEFKFIDQGLKKENIQPYDTKNDKYYLYS